MQAEVMLHTQKTATPHASAQYWRVCQVEELYDLPFMDLVYRAAQVHREHFNPNEIQLSSLLSIKTGGCPEDCAYCPQSAHYDTGVEKQALLQIEEIVAKAKIAKERGASRFCMGAAWRGPHQRDMHNLTEIIAAVKALGMETCGTFGLLKDDMSEQLQAAGLDYYNHNLDTAPDKYADIISTRQFEDRMNTLGQVRESGMKVCCGGIIGMQEQRKDRAGLLASLANLDPQPESVPINQLVKVEGVPLADAEDLDWTEFVRTIAVARIIMPQSYVRLSAGRKGMTEATQALCFMAGANSIFYGDVLLTTENPADDVDRVLMDKLDLRPLALSAAE